MMSKRRDERGFPSGPFVRYTAPNVEVLCYRIIFGVPTWGGEYKARDGGACVDRLFPLSNPLSFLPIFLHFLRPL